eukprot:7320607-Prymnesium_polylepis.1
MSCTGDMSWFGRRGPWPATSWWSPIANPLRPPRPPHCDFAMSLRLDNIELGQYWVNPLSVPESPSPESSTPQ